MNLKLLIVMALFLLSKYTYAQEDRYFTLVQADKQLRGVEIDKYVGNVEFIRGENYLYCDSASQFKLQNKLECFGNVKVIKAGAYTLTGDHLIVDEKKGKVLMEGNVFLRTKKREVIKRRYKLRLQ